jgi:ribosomal-protein-alanine N-acetyltransferase
MAHAVDRGGRLAGFILSRVAADEAEVLTLAVAPELRRKGLGAALLARAAREARTGGAKRLLLEVAADNHPALSLYERAGFAKVGARKAYYDRQGGADALTLALDLNR